MNMNRFPSGIWSSKRRAITLIEVVVGLALLGGVLATALVGSSHHLRQMRRAADKQRAVTTLDRFMVAWARADFTEHESVRIGKSLGIRVQVYGAPPLSNAFEEGDHNGMTIVIGERQACPFPGASRRRINAFTPSAEQADTWVEVVTRDAS
jgi:type II secretory pathway pseudopilin PulG